MIYDVSLFLTKDSFQVRIYFYVSNSQLSLLSLDWHEWGGGSETCQIKMFPS